MHFDLKIEAFCEAWQVNVHEFIALKLLDGPACCLCCQGQCGWASDWPAGYVADAQVEDRFELNGLQMRGPTPSQLASTGGHQWLSDGFQ